MLVVLLAFTAVAMLAPLAVKLMGRNAFLPLSVLPAAVFVWGTTLIPRVLDGEVVRWSIPWVPQLGLTLSFRVDALALVMLLVATGVGALVLVYCWRYFSSTEPALGRFAGVFVAFAGAMVGLVTADDVYILFVFWEATTVLSYLLITHKASMRAARGAALQALLVTTFGGLAMLVGFVLLAVQADSPLLSVILPTLPNNPLTITAVMLVLAGALSKSAIVPFQFWLPAAMAAPTPVSAYLHAAAMVKAGVYLVAVFAPAASHLPGWHAVLIPLASITAVLGAWAALKQKDIKLILAHGTVSQLGLLTLVAAIGTAEAGLAMLAMLVAHALYKSSLFLVVGIVDHRYGTRDVRKLSGVGAQSPVLAVIAALAVASMIGVIPTLGFVGKESALIALLDGSAVPGPDAAWSIVALVAVIVTSVLTVAYGIRFLWGAFARKRGVDTVPAVKRRVRFVIAPAILSVAGVVAGIGVAGLDPLIATYAAEFGEVHEHLALWHGFTVPLGITVAVLAAGAGIAAIVLPSTKTGPLRAAVQRRVAAPPVVTGTELYSLTIRGIDRLAARTTSVTQRGSLPFYLGVILTVFVGGSAVTLAVNQSWSIDVELWGTPVQAVIALLIVIAVIAAVRAVKRFQAAVLVGVTGLAMAALFAFHGAPDLAITQLLVELVTMVAIVLVLRRLPARLGEANGSRHAPLRAILGVLVGLAMAVIAVVAAGVRTGLPISLEWPELAYEGGHGKNVVNVALVDLRGWDTMGELSVIIAAATGVASLVFLSTRASSLPRITRREAINEVRQRNDVERSEGAAARSPWLLAGRTLAPHHRSILLEVVVRLTFHAVIVLSLYVLLVGHNEPGGGFAGGLIAGMAFVARYLAGGRYELGMAAPIDAGKLLGAGMILAAGTALAPLFFGVDALTSTWFTIPLGPLGSVDFVTSTIFDIGVYLVVVGLVLDVLRSLGAQVDRDEERALGIFTDSVPGSSTVGGDR